MTWGIVDWARRMRMPHDVAAPAAMAAVGLLTATRYLVPGLMGIPLVVGSRLTASPAAFTPRR